MEVQMYENGFESENKFHPQITKKARLLSQSSNGNSDYDRPKGMTSIEHGKILHVRNKQKEEYKNKVREM